MTKFERDHLRNALTKLANLFPFASPARDEVVALAEWVEKLTLSEDPPLATMATVNELWSEHEIRLAKQEARLKDIEARAHLPVKVGMFGPIPVFVSEDAKGVEIRTSKGVLRITGLVEEKSDGE